jgi:hypothetical protein
VPGSVVRSFTTKSLNVFARAGGISDRRIFDPLCDSRPRSLPSVARSQPRRDPPELTSSG